MPDHTADRVEDGSLKAAAYAALAELERVNELAATAPGLPQRMALADEGARRYELYRAALARLDADTRNAPNAAAPTSAIDEARQRTRTSEWWEGLAAASLSAELSDELFAALTGQIKEDREGDAADTSWPQHQIRDAVSNDPTLAARLSLWSRRLVGEAIVLAHEFGGDDYPQLAAQLATAHARRMAALGLTE